MITPKILSTSSKGGPTLVNTVTITTIHTGPTDPAIIQDIILYGYGSNTGGAAVAQTLYISEDGGTTNNVVNITGAGFWTYRIRIKGHATPVLIRSSSNNASGNISTTAYTAQIQEIS